jgi:glucose uptake protein
MATPSIITIHSDLRGRGFPVAEGGKITHSGGFNLPAIGYALVTVIAWGTWIPLSQTVPFKNQQIKMFYVGAANLALAFLVALVMGGGRIELVDFWLPFAGGLIWAVSGLCAFIAADKIGVARAVGIWSPLNIIVSLIWGQVLFNEFLNMSPLNLTLLFLSVAVIIGGVLMIVFAKGRGESTQDKKTLIAGFAAAVGAGILWGTYFIPIKLSGVSLWEAAFPMAMGIFIGGVLLALMTRKPIRLDQTRHYLIASAAGIIWGIGNYGMLLLVDELGAGKGFTIAQLSVVVNALLGIYWLKDPHPRSRAAGLTLIGCVLATLGGIILGNL